MKKKFFLIGFVLLSRFCSQSYGQDYNYDPSTTEEFRMRDGLPHFFNKVHAGEEVRVAYLGGSITAARGWRVKTLAWFKSQYPNVQFTEINAAISGTGTGFGACRIGADILPHQPDLVLMESRVNGGQGVERQSVEGIIRQIKAASPETDICFVYTIGEWFKEDIITGKNSEFGSVLEEVANYYGIPSIDMGIEIVKQEAAGTLVFKSDIQKEGIITFSRDGIHPGNDGHEIYTEVISRNFLEMDKIYPKQPKNKIKPKLYENAWELGTLIPIEKTEKSAEWIPVDIQKDSIYRKDFRRTNGMLRGAVKCTEPGGVIEIEWEGTTLGMHDLTQNNTMVIEVQIDGGETMTYPRPQDSPRQLYARFAFFPELKNGKHTAKLTVKELPKGESYYVGQFLQAGTKSVNPKIEE
ncbi:GDSL-type esterase/lipase family protein [Bacteroidota bacterium]